MLNNLPCEMMTLKGQLNSKHNVRNFLTVHLSINIPARKGYVTNRSVGFLPFHRECAG